MSEAPKGVTGAGHEGAPRPPKESYIRTDVGALRGEQVARDGTHLTLRVLWTADGKGIGNLNKILLSSIAGGEPMRVSISTDGGQTWEAERESAPVRALGTWERSTPVSLDDLIARTENHALSASLRENPIQDLSGETESLKRTNEPYRNAMPEYEYVDEAVQHALAHPHEAKFAAPFGTNNIGWKSHLAVAPEDVRAVSEYLKRNGYRHKYLTGGIGSEGAAFTLYFGPKSTMDRWAPVLAADLASYLRKPLIKSEVEVAPGIVSRFGVKPALGTYLAACAYGVPTRREFVEMRGGWEKMKTNEDKRAAARDAYQHLAAEYGSYFHG